MGSNQGALAARLRARLASWRIIAVFGVIYLASQWWIASILHPLGPATVLELQTTLSVETFVQILERWRDADVLAIYQRHYAYDFLHPLWYSVLLAATVAKAFDANSISQHYDGFLFVPFAAAGLDLVENLLHVLFLSNDDAIVAPLVVVSGVAASLKWALAGSCLVVVLALTVGWCLRAASFSRDSG